MLVGTINVCFKDEEIVTVVLSLYHCTRGIGLAVALQYNITKLPTVVM